MRAVLVAIMLAILVPFTASGAPSFHYTIEDYRAVFSPAEYGSDVRVRLEILYDVGVAPKSDGFKYVGTKGIKNVACTDGGGRKLRCKISHESEERIDWYFPAVHNTKQAVVVEFTQVDALEWRNGKYVLDFPWVGVFRVPVKKVRYEMLFPAGMNPVELKATPAQARVSTIDGRTLVTFTQSPLMYHEFRVEYALKHGANTIPMDRPDSRSEDESQSNGINAGTIIGYLIMFVFASLILFSIILKIAKKKGWSLGGLADYDFGGHGDSGGCSGGDCSGGCGGCGGGCGG